MGPAFTVLPTDVMVHINDVRASKFRLIGILEAKRRGWPIAAWPLPGHAAALDVLRRLLRKGYIPVDAVLVKRGRSDYQRVWIFAMPIGVAYRRDGIKELIGIS